MLKRRAACGAVAAVIVGFAIGCQRQPAAQSGVSPASQQLPFGAGKNGIPPTGQFTLDSVPAGTPVTVRLQTAISSASSVRGGSFAAVLDEALVVDGQTAVPDGVPVQGRVVAARKATSRHDPGYLRLTLVAIEVQGKSIPVQASSIFAKGGSQRVAVVGAAARAAGSLHGERNDVSFPAEHRLTFRLLQPLPLGG